MKKRVEKYLKEKADKVDSVTGEEPPKTADDYQCSGNLEQDFTKLCKLMSVKDIPSVKIKQSSSTNRRVMENQMTTWSSKPCLRIQLENEDHGSVKEVKISGWRMDEVVLQVLSRILPSLSNLQCLHMWRVGLTDYTFTSMRNTVSLCSNLRKVVLEGNPLPEQSYHLLIAENSMLTDLSLRNNHIGEEGARLIGSALSTVHSPNKNLLSLNLAFNSIGDAGAIHISQGLRLNRSLLCLSLSYNQIGDNGAAHLAEVLGPFALTHEEIVERRKLLIKGEESTMLQPSLVSLADSHERPLSVRSSSSLDRLNKSTKNPTKKKDNPKKEEKPAAGQAAKKEEPKVAKKDELLQNKYIFTLWKYQIQTLLKSTQLQNILVHYSCKFFFSDNAGNKMSEQSLKVFLSSLEGQGEGGLLRLSLNRNQFPSDCDTFLKIQEIMSIRDPLKKNLSGQVEDEHDEPKTTSEA
uniref:Si:ch211-81a5.5 n=1 Tax=Cyprinus carpio TaxID=7962 RepID=A0A8C1GHI8_CYPCA